MADIVITFDEQQLRKVDSELRGIAGGSKKAMVRAINKAGAKAKTRVTKRLVSLAGLARKVVAPRIKFDHASAANLQGVVRITGRPIRLILFNATQNAAGVATTVPVGSQSYPHAFIVTVPFTGHRGVFIRTGNRRTMTKGRYAGHRREEITEIPGPPLSRIFEGAPGVAAEEMANINKDLPEALASAVDGILGRSKSERT